MVISTITNVDSVSIKNTQEKSISTGGNDVHTYKKTITIRTIDGGTVVLRLESFEHIAITETPIENDKGEIV